MKVERPVERAERIIEPVLGTRSDPIPNRELRGEGLQIVVNLIRAENGRRGFDTCEFQDSEESCRKCQLLGSRMCDLVNADQERIDAEQRQRISNLAQAANMLVPKVPEAPYFVRQG